jgi:hypothetical protein
MQSHSAPPGLCPPTTGARGAAAPAHARPPTARWSSRARWLYGCKDPASRSGGSRELEKPALRAICEDTRNAVRARVRLCPTACPTALQFPMVKPNQAGIIIRVSGVRVPPPASRKSARIRLRSRSSHGSGHGDPARALLPGRSPRLTAGVDPLPPDPFEVGRSSRASAVSRSRDRRRR